MKWLVWLVGLIGVGWGSLAAMYAVAVVMLAPLAVRVDSADFRDAVTWMFSVLLFYIPFVFSYVVSLLLKKQRFRRGALIMSAIGIVLLAYSLSRMEEQWSFVSIHYVVPLIGWLVTAIYLNKQQKNVVLTLGKYDYD